MNVIITILIQDKEVSSNAFIMEKQRNMKMEGPDNAHVYSNIGGIDQPTYFSELTHCSLN